MMLRGRVELLGFRVPDDRGFYGMSLNREVWVSTQLFGCLGSQVVWDSGLNVVIMRV